MGITPRQFEAMQQRGRRGATARPAQVFAAGAAPHQVILGVDPSLRGTGFGIIRLARPCPQVLAQGTVHCRPAWERSRCLVMIAESLRDLVRTHQPGVCVMEGLFYAQNFQTALIMGEARGASLVAVAEAGLPVYEMAPRKVKQAVVGHGAAQKLAVARMVQRLLQLPETPVPDAADALALALAYAQEAGRLSLAPLKRI